MIQFQENTQADGRKDKRTEGQTDPTLKDPSGYQQGSKKYNCSRLALKVKGTEDVGLTKITASQPACKKSAPFINSFLRSCRF